MTQRDCDDCRYYKLEGAEEPCKSCNATDEGFTNWKKREHPTMTNADRIRAMSDEEIAEWVCANGAIKTPCDIICGGDCKALATFDKSSMDVCKEIVMKWLQQPAEDSANG